MAALLLALLLPGALAIGAAHADDHRLHASDGCAVCRHVRCTPVVVDGAIAVAPLRFSLPVWACAEPAPRAGRAPRARARGPPVVS